MLTDTEREIIARAKACAADDAPPNPRLGRGWRTLAGRCLNQNDFVSTIEYMKRTGIKRAKVQDYSDVI